MPIAMASLRARSTCTLARASGPVTHFDAPVRVAMRPSSESASLSDTYGRPAVMCFAHGAMDVWAFSSRTPRTTSMPAARSFVGAVALDVGVRVAAPDDDARDPDAMIASVHGGVRPWWLHGSSVT